jgi:hypothetical protein
VDAKTLLKKMVGAAKVLVDQAERAEPDIDVDPTALALARMILEYASAVK